MGKQDFVHIKREKQVVVIPTNILENPALSLGAKGLYIQLYHSTSKITSLNNITELSSSSKEQIDEWFTELTETGYITIDKNGNASIAEKPQGAKTIAKKLDKEAVKTFTETTIEKEKPLSIYDKMVRVIDSYELPANVKNLLVVYFEKWLNRKGRFADADQLHAAKVRALIGDLISFHVDEKAMITIVQTSIDHEYYKFFIPSESSKSSGPGKPSSQFDKSQITSGSFTQADIDEIKNRAAKLEEDGKKGLF